MHFETLSFNNNTILSQYVDYDICVLEQNMIPIIYIYTTDTELANVFVFLVVFLHMVQIIWPNPEHFMVT